MKFYKYLVLLGLILLTGCTYHQTVQLDGYPLPENVVRTHVFGITSRLTYQLIRIYDIKEGEESYETYEHLLLAEGDVNLVGKNAKKLQIDIQLYNPNKEFYEIEGVLEMLGTPIVRKVWYKGKLSRNIINIDLPLQTNSTLGYYFIIRDEDDNIVYRSFKAKYRVTKLDRY